MLLSDRIILPAFDPTQLFRLLMLLLFLSGCKPGEPISREAAIQQIMIDQERAWDSGDITGFMKGYSDTICFVGMNGSTCGIEAVTANYARSYPDGSAMGDLTFDQLEILPAGELNAWVTGRWRLDRKSDTLSGGFSLLWALEQDEWRIVRDHSY